MDNSKLHIVAVNGFLKNTEGKYLILKRSEKEVAYPGKWSVPGGKVEGKDSIKEALKREFLEESGLVIGDEIKFLGEFEFTRPDGYHVIGMRFLCEYVSGDLKIDENDFSDGAWMGLEELDKYDLIDGVRKEFEMLKI